MSRKGVVLAASAAAVVGLAAAAALWAYKKRRSSNQKSKSNTTVLSNNNDTTQLLQQQFQQAAQASRELQNLQNGDKLLLYGLYKQATVGDCNEENGEPSRFDVIAHAKFESHLKFKGMPCHAAMQMYIQVVKEFSTTKDMEYETEELDMFNAMGVRPSTLATTTTSDDEDDDDNSTTTPLLKAARDGNLKKLKEVLQQMNGKTSVIVNTTDDSGQTALHFAADRGYCEIVELLLDAGANPNAADLEGIGVLQAAVIAGHADVASILLHKFGANPLQADMDGDTPHSCAQDDGSKEMKLLFSDDDDDEQPTETTSTEEYWG